MDELTTEPGSCLDENQIAAWVEGSVLDAERAAIEKHLADCLDCRALVGRLIRAERQGESAAARFGGDVREWTLTHWRQGLAVAAMLVLLTGTWALMRTGSATRVDAPPLVTDGFLLAQAEILANNDPSLFADFRPLGREERLGVDGPVLRGGLTLHTPARTILETRPEFGFELAHGTSRYRLSVYHGSEQVLSRTCETSPCPYPAEARDLMRGGSYVWELEAPERTPPSSGMRAFTVATVAEAEAILAALDAIQAMVPDPGNRLLAAHYAIRRGCYGRAERDARAFLAAVPENVAGHETLYHVLTILGSGEAERHRPR